MGLIQICLPINPTATAPCIKQVVRLSDFAVRSRHSFNLQRQLSSASSDIVLWYSSTALSPSPLVRACSRLSMQVRRRLSSAAVAALLAGSLKRKSSASLRRGFCIAPSCACSASAPVWDCSARQTDTVQLQLFVSALFFASNSYIYRQQVHR